MIGGQRWYHQIRRWKLYRLLVVTMSVYLQRFGRNFTRDSRMLHRLSNRHAGRLSVCLSVRPSVSLCDCIKTVQAITKSSPWDAPKTLAYLNKFLFPWVKRFLSNYRASKVAPPKKTFWRYWLV